MSSYPPPPPPPPPPGYGPPPSGPYGGYGGYGPTRSTNGKAIAALVCGIAAFVVCPLTGIAAVILGPMAKKEIAAQPDRYDGGGMATAGQILGWIAVALMVIFVVFIVLVIIFGSTTDSTFESLGALASVAG